MFLGEFKHICDSKNRLRLPPKFKKDLSDGAVLTKGSDGCLFIVSKSMFENILNKVNNLPLFNSKAQQPLRLLFSSALEIEEDNQGRFLLTSTLKDYAKITKNVVFVGVGSRVELWAEEEWQKYSENSNSNFDNLLANLGEYGI